MYYKLIRYNQVGNAVYGKLFRTSHYFNLRTGQTTERRHFICDTLENADHLILPLIYPVTVTRSPKFGRLLPSINQVPGRTGIRIHRGTRPEHSRGCILVTPENEALLTARFRAEQSANEECRLEIVDNCR